VRDLSNARRLYLVTCPRVIRSFCYSRGCVLLLARHKDYVSLERLYCLKPSTRSPNHQRSPDKKCDAIA